MSGYFTVVLAIFRLLCSLKLAIVIILTLSASMAAGTVLESLYDTPTAQYWVYRARWFHAVLALLGVQIFCVAMSRLPWKKRHIPFLLAHLGILMLLVGSWITDKFGIDGMLRFEEGDTVSVVEMTQPLLILADDKNVRTVPVTWTPPHAKFDPIEVPQYGLRVTEFLSHADVNVNFTPVDEAEGKKIPARAAPAFQLKIKGGAMRLNQEFWLWSGDPNWATLQMGPARVTLLNPDSSLLNVLMSAPGPWLVLIPRSSGEIEYRSKLSDGSLREGRLSKTIEGKTIATGWAGGVEVEILRYIPTATSQVSYSPSKIQYGPAAPPSAIRVVAGGDGRDGDVWIGLGERAVLEHEGRKIAVSYFPHRIVLPFGLQLDRFTIERYEGSQDPREFASQVTVKDREEIKNIVISMNEPLKHGGFTFYQSSYEDAVPRPVTSILSVNQDPGRELKYAGSLLIVLGAILLYFSRFRKKQPARTPEISP